MRLLKLIGMGLIGYAVYELAQGIIGATGERSRGIPDRASSPSRATGPILTGRGHGRRVAVGDGNSLMPEIVGRGIVH